MDGKLSNHEIHTLSSRFDLQVRDEAACLLWYIWRKSRASYSKLSACISALKDEELYVALKEAGASGDYDAIQCWRETSPSCLSESEYAIVGDIYSFVGELRPAMKKLVDGEITLPLWTPDCDLDPDVVAHLTALSIPCLKGKPNLLLHDLGSFTRDPLLDKRLKNIFMPNNHTFLVNTSGSGKTRLLMEGLCENWGFYFTSLVDSSFLGSSDIQNSIKTHVPNSKGFRKVLPPAGCAGYDNSLHANREIASRIFRRIFLARLLIFHLFAETMTQECLLKLNASTSRVYRSRWLFLQLQPSVLHPQVWDIFDALSCKLSRASDAFVNTTTKNLLGKVRTLLSPSVPVQPLETISNSSPVTRPLPTTVNDSTMRQPLFCVLDEAQHAATEHSSSFRSDQNGAHRPILREIVKAWEEQSFGQGVFMVVAGTGISKGVVDQAMGSAIMKDSRYRWCSDTGAFDCRDGQFKYLAKYFPRKLLSSESGQRLLERVWYWLHGRYRFTSGYVAELLLDGFKRPHGLLNAYVEHFTNFKVTDAVSFVNSERQGAWPVFSQLKIDFSKLKKNTDMLSTIHQLTTHYLMRSILPITLGKDEAAYVEYGFARFVDSETQSVAVDEPLVLLAATHWINLHHHSSYRHFTREILKHDRHSNGFENYLAFCIDMIFSQRRKLSEIFAFLGTPPSWSDMEAELVTLYSYNHTGTDSSDGSIDVDMEVVEESTVQHFHFSGPSVTLGTNAKSLEETARWLKHKTHSPICFPHNWMGPDLIFILRLSDGSLIWVVLQAKFHQGKNGKLSKTFLRHAMRSLTPSLFFLDKDSNPFSPTSHPTLISDTSLSLSQLPHPRTDAGRFSLLRVIVSFPADPGMKRCIGEDPDPDGHPIASLDMRLVKQITGKLSPVDFLVSLERSLQDRQSQERVGKRKRAVVVEGKKRRSKKIKLN